uniref:Uncharacterized protein n=1 Tax=Ditylenchus dipsaci TaxID=166011 RepID=A0A915CVN9_9BILA
MRRLESKIEAAITRVDKLSDMEESNTGLALQRLRYGCRPKNFVELLSRSARMEKASVSRQVSRSTNAGIRNRSAPVSIERGMRVAVWPTTTNKIAMRLTPGVNSVIALMEWKKGLMSLTPVTKRQTLSKE